MGMLADQLLSIASSRRENIKSSNECVEIMKEFLLREYQWANYLGLAGEVPFVDLAKGIDPSVRCPEEEMAFLKLFGESVSEMRVCRSLLHWDALQTQMPEKLETVSLPDPYESMIRFFMQGGCFTHEHRVFIEVNRFITLHYGSLVRASAAKGRDS